MKRKKNNPSGWILGSRTGKEGPLDDNDEGCDGPDSDDGQFTTVPSTLHTWCTYYCMRKEKAIEPIGYSYPGFGFGESYPIY